MPRHLKENSSCMIEQGKFSCSLHGPHAARRQTSHCGSAHKETPDSFRFGGSHAVVSAAVQTSAIPRSYSQHTLVYGSAADFLLSSRLYCWSRSCTGSAMADHAPQSSASSPWVADCTASREFQLIELLLSDHGHPTPKNFLFYGEYCSTL